MLVDQAVIDAKYVSLSAHNTQSAEKAWTIIDMAFYDNKPAVGEALATVN